jgi:hypothetical protein
VIVHSAVQAYLSSAQREALSSELQTAVDDGRAHWISNEGAQVVPQIAAAMDETTRSGLRRGAFVVSVDGRPRYQADGHAGWILGMPQPIG